MNSRNRYYKNNASTTLNFKTKKKKIPITKRGRRFRRNMFIHTKSVKQVFTIMQRSISEDINSFINRHFFGYGRELPQVRPKSFNTFTICQSNIGCSPRTKLNLKLTIIKCINNKQIRGGH